MLDEAAIGGMASKCPRNDLWRVEMLSLSSRRLRLICHDKRRDDLKALALLTAVAVTLFSIAASAQTGPYYGKGKAPPPPPPVVTKG
jgi:hypothetical protein